MSEHEVPIDGREPRDFTPRRLVHEPDWGIFVDLTADGTLDIVIHDANVGDMRVHGSLIRTLFVDHVRVEAVAVLSSVVDDLTLKDNWVSEVRADNNTVSGTKR